MKKYLISSILLIISSFSFAQKTDPTPYCKALFDPNYNMIKSITIDGHTKAFGPEGKETDKGKYLYFDTEKFPDIKMGVPAKFTLEFYSIDYIGPRYFSLWIDWDHDNDFSFKEMIMYNENTIFRALGTFSEPDDIIVKSITVPTTALPGKTRMRIARGTYSAKPDGPYEPLFNMYACSPVGAPNGCTYDFDVNIVAVPPVANFASSAKIGTVATVFGFTELCSFTPTKFKWSFTPPNVMYKGTSSDTAANPRINFTAPGLYTAKLVVTNSGGKDSMVKKDMILINGPTGIDDLSNAQESLNIYPNPAKGFIMLHKNFAGAELQILDVQGKLVKTTTISNEKIDIANLASGVYFARIINGEESHTQMFSVEK